MTNLEKLIDEREKQMEKIEKYIDQGKEPEEVIKNNPEVYDEFMLRWLEIFA